MILFLGHFELKFKKFYYTYILYLYILLVIYFVREITDEI